MNRPNTDKRRRYHAPARQQAAERRREAIVTSAHERFVERGWSGTTVKSVAERAGVSPKTVEALFGTKAALLRAAVDLAIRGDTGATPVAERASFLRVRAAPTARAMLRLHATHLRQINPRSAAIAWVVEHAAAADASVAEVWSRMNHNRRHAVATLAAVLSTKPGRRRSLARSETEAIFWVALDWGTYRTLCHVAGLDDDAYEAWLRRYYTATLLARPS